MVEVGPRAWAGDDGLWWRPGLREGFEPGGQERRKGPRGDGAVGGAL